MNKNNELPVELFEACDLLGLQVESIARSCVLDYQKIQHNYTLLAAALQSGLWEKKVVDTYKHLGVKRLAGKILFNKPAEDRMFSLLTARDFLRAWVDQDGQMKDKFGLRVDPANENQGNLVIKILINGAIVPDDDYCLEVETFFNSIAAIKSWTPSRVSFIGECGIAS